MKSSIWRKLDVIARQLVPCALTFAMLLVGVVPLHVTAFQAIAPSLPLIAVFYWTLYRPDLMPAVAVFAIGLLQDILFGLPIGFLSIILVSLVTRAPSKAVQDMVDATRRPSGELIMKEKGSGMVAGH